jgi:hypothetical protein
MTPAGGGAVSVVQLFQEAAFGPELTRLMGDAFERAARSLHDTGQPELIREVMARRIIDAVRRGVRDPRELCAEATRSLGVKIDCDN